MTIEEALVALVTADAPMLALIGTRIYPTQPEAKATFPYVIYEQADAKTTMTYGGPKRLNSWTMDLECWALTKASAKAVSKALRNLLLGHRGDSGGLFIQGIFDQTESDDSASPQHGDERGLFAVSMTLELWYRASA